MIFGRSLKLLYMLLTPFGRLLWAGKIFRRFLLTKTLVTLLLPKSPPFWATAAVWRILKAIGEWWGPKRTVGRSTVGLLLHIHHPVLTFSSTFSSMLAESKPLILCPIKSSEVLTVPYLARHSIKIVRCFARLTICGHNGSPIGFFVSNNF